MAEATKMGAMMAEYQPLLSNLQTEKIQAVTECTRNGAGQSETRNDGLHDVTQCMFTKYSVDHQIQRDDE